MHRTASLFGFTLLFACIAEAGGDSWRVKVLGVSPLEVGRVTLVLEPLEVSYEWKGCAKGTIVSTFDLEIIGLRTWSASLDQDKYEKALAALRGAAVNSSVIRFGSMGTGFKPTSDKCRLLSRGLEVLEEPSGSVAVYSYYGPT
jgi:hypothetical protein